MNTIFNYFTFFIILLINFYWKVNIASYKIGQSIVPNQYSSLGKNNPLRLLDCSIFQLEKGMCCLLTITKTRTDIDDDDDVEGKVEYYETACIFLEKIDAQIINSTTTQYKNLGGDVLIECSQLYIDKYYILITLFFAILLL